eukprot:CAMPEP_0113592814 /NCGR_PEP_ID=MMETSP0015_2-20120614/38059_1 /TAXON_ID=2838 /ORGANISM="Odontella" /LENGTH=244 /DNA_ID=CAMNT_0000499399 /DNA_START=160 /DNA_END=890 /DNA_ORIENTATION=- /assembly_acc=CAM_ASM_000160
MRRGASLPTRGRRVRASSNASSASAPSSADHDRTSGQVEGSNGRTGDQERHLHSPSSDKGQVYDEETESETLLRNDSHLDDDGSSGQAFMPAEGEELIDQDEGEDEEIDVVGMDDAPSQLTDATNEHFEAMIDDQDNDKNNGLDDGKEKNGRHYPRRAHPAPSVASSPAPPSPLASPAPSDRGTLGSSRSSRLLFAILPTEGIQMTVRVVYGRSTYSEHAAVLGLETGVGRSTSRSSRAGRGGR